MEEERAYTGPVSESEPPDTAGWVEPPPNFVFPPEFLSPTPRPVPARFHEWGYLRRRRLSLWWTAVGAVACAILARMHFVRVLGAFVPALRYLDWGAGICVVGFVGEWAYAALGFGRERFLRHGRPVPALIVDLRKSPASSHGGVAVTYHFVAKTLARDPDGGAVTAFELESPPFHARKKDDFEIDLVLGQFVPAVFLPGRFAKTLTLYGFLELDQKHKLVYDATIEGPARRRSTARIPLMTIGGLALLLIALYSGAFYFPLDVPAALLVVSGCIGAALGGMVVVWLWRESRHEVAVMRENAVTACSEGRAIETIPTTLFARPGAFAWYQRIIVIPGAPLLATAAVLMFLVTLNAVLDSAPAAAKPVKVIGLNQTTYEGGLYRSYSVKFSIDDESCGCEHDFPVMPDKIRTFVGRDGRVVKNAMAMVRPGYFGWPWVERVDSPPVDGDGAMRFRRF